MAASGGGVAGVRITGLRESTKAMKQLDADAGKEVTKLNREAAEIVAATARRLAPVGKSPDPHPGQLVGTIKVGATQHTSYVRAGSKTVLYGNPIHWGWPKRNIKGSLFMTRALVADAAPVREVYERGFRALIQKVGLA